jgi:hypothetical protein
LWGEAGTSESGANDSIECVPESIRVLI